MKYPMTFEVSSQATPGIQTAFEAKSHDLPTISCAIPPEFQGAGNGYSPEDLYTLSLVTCFIATFKVFAEKSQFSFQSIILKANLTIDRNEKGVPTLTRIETEVTLYGAQDQEKARKLLQDAERYCLVSNAIKSEKTYSYKFV
jgi:organic hydroperoxide reductase OsmC/OhrA